MYSNLVLNPFPRFTIIQTPLWPVVQDGWNEVRYPGHPITVWLSRLIKRVFGRTFDPDIVKREPHYRDSDIIIAGTTIYCSPKQATDLRNKGLI